MKWIALIAVLVTALSSHAARKINSHQRSISTTLSRITNGLSSQQANLNSLNLSFSSDGRYSVFQSNASNLVSGDTNGATDIFLFDSNTSTMTLVSKGLSSVPANGASFDPMISGDGNYVAFTSYASNLVSSDTNKKADIFLYNKSSGVISRLSVSTAGAEANGDSGEASISGDGSIVSFSSLASNLVASDTNSVSDVFTRNVSGSTTTRVSLDSSSTQGNGPSYQSKVSYNGSVVAFVTDATNLVGSDTNSCADVLSKNLSTNAVQLVSSSSSGTIGNRSSTHPDISQTGQYVVFESRAGNLVSQDVNGYIDIFIKDLNTGATKLVSVTTSGAQVKSDSVLPSISLDGRFVVFESRAVEFVSWDTNNLGDVFLRDLTTSLTTPFSTLASDQVGNGKSSGAKISGNGAVIGFNTLSTNLLAPDTNGFSDLLKRANPYSTSQVVYASKIANLNENGTSQNAFLISRLGNTASALTVYYSISGTATSGTDFTALNGSATISSGASSVAIPITPLSDSIVEPTESIILTISNDAAYLIGGFAAAQTDILDPTGFAVSVVATDNVASEDEVNWGNFRISRTGGTIGDLIVNLTFSGTAIPNVDYIGLPNTVVIPNGQAYIDLPLKAIEDSFGEFDESVTVTLAAGSGYVAGSSSADTVTIKDNDYPVVNLSLLDSVLDATNVSDTGVFRISREFNSSQSLTVYYALKGTAQNSVDYVTLTGSAVIAAGNSYVDVTVTPILNYSVEGYKTILVELLPGAIYGLGNSQSATLILKESYAVPTVTIEAYDAIATEDGTNTGIFRISRSGATTGSLVVNYTIAGDAINGVDYQTIASSATIPNGQSYVDIVITGIEDTLAESQESVVLALHSSANYIVDSVKSRAEVIIQDNEFPTVQIFAESKYAMESQRQNAKIKLVRDGNISSALTVGLLYSGTATNGTDYTSPGSTVVIPALQREYVFEIPAVIDGLIEGNEGLLVQLGGSSNYNIGFSSAAQFSVVDSTYKILPGIIPYTPNAPIQNVTVSDNGQLIAFESTANNLVAGDTNDVSDVFIINTATQATFRIMGLGGVQQNGASRSPMISGDGRYVVFSSVAANLIPNDINYKEDVFLYEISTGLITYVSKGYTQFPRGESLNPYISQNANYIAFESKADNLVPNDFNQVSDIFVYKVSNGTLNRVSLKSNGSEFESGSFNPSVDDNGKRVAFASKQSLTGPANEYLNIYLADLSSNTTSMISKNISDTDPDGDSFNPSVSGNGKVVVFSSYNSRLLSEDVNSVLDVFRYEVPNDSLEIVSKDQNGWIANRASLGPSVDAKGEFVAFASSAKNLGNGFNCTSSAYVKSSISKKIVPIENGSIDSCLRPAKSVYISNSGKFLVSTVSTTNGSQELLLSPNQLQ